MATNDVTMLDYSIDAIQQQVPQKVAMDTTQIPNSAGGYVWPVSDMVRVRRFLCLGSEGGTYYIQEKKLGKENAETIIRMIKQGKGCDVVMEIMEFSLEGRAAKQEPIIFSLAICARLGDVETKKSAYIVLSKVCRIPTHLFSFIEYCEALSVGTGWGRSHRTAIANWYTSKQPENLCNLVTKYQQRNGWSHRDLLRLCHVKTDKTAHNIIFRYIIKGIAVTREDYEELSATDPTMNRVLDYLIAVDSAKMCTTPEAIIPLITQYNLAREHIPTVLLNFVEVWRTLLAQMPMTAMIRNLGKMTSIGLLSPLTTEVNIVADRLLDVDKLKSARIHPFNVLVALNTYSHGRGDKGSLSWHPVPAIIDALDKAFYLSFKFVQPTGKRFLLALDVSGSMTSSILGARAVSCREASAAMAMVTMKTESQYHVLGFSDALVNVSINATMDLKTVCKRIGSIPMGATDCALPMLWASKKKAMVDVFIVYTDNETWFGKVHPAQALKDYRKSMNPEAKLIVIGMTSSGFTIADPNDAGMIDITGFDSAAPEIIRSFTLGII